MADRLRILYVHHRSEPGGAPTSLSYLIRSLDPEQFDLHAYCPPGPAAELFRRSGAEVHTGSVAGFTHIWASVYRGRRWLLLAREILRLPGHALSFWLTLRRTKPDIVHLNDSPLLPAALLAWLTGTPIVWHLRSALPDDGTGRRSRFIRRTIGRLASSSIAINDDVAQSFGLESIVVPNAVDLQRFRPGNARESRISLDLPPDRPVVTYFGFLYPSKGFIEFIQVGAKLRARGVDAMLLIVGGAVRDEAFFRTFLGRVLRVLDLARNYEREARQLIERDQLHDRVRLVPFTDETAVLYRASDVVIAPSRGPELGRPVIEAAASGVPIIATGSRTGGGVLVPGVTGLLVENDVERLVESTEALLLDDERRQKIGAAARAHAEEQFDPQRNAELVAQLYRRLTAGEPGGDNRVPVLYVHHRPQLGGAPSSLAALICNLDPRFVAHVFTPEGPSANLFRTCGAIVHIGPAAIFSHAWDSPYAGVRWLILARELLHLPGHLISLSSLLRRERFAIVHLNDSPLLPAAWAAHRSGAKVVWHLRSALAGGGKDIRSRVIGSLIDRWGDVAIAIDTDVAARFPIRLPVTIIHNSVTTTGAVPTTDRAALGLPDDRVTIGFAGFVRRQKGWRELVEATRILIEQDKPVHVVIMGGGVRPPAYFHTLRGRFLSAMTVIIDEESAIKDVVAQAGLNNCFSFFPFTTDTAAIYTALDIVTFPNQGIGLGRPVLEASMFGKPVVAGGSHDGAGVMIPGVTGLLLEQPTPEALAAALGLLVDDVELRREMGEAGRAHALEHFDPERNARAVEDVYDRLLQATASVRARGRRKHARTRARA